MAAVVTGTVVKVWQGPERIKTGDDAADRQGRAISTELAVQVIAAHF